MATDDAPVRHDELPRGDVSGAGTPSLGVALALWGTSVALMLLVFAAFYLYQTRARDLTAPLFSAAISVGAVLAPTLAACFWTAGRLPSYEQPSREVLAGAFFVSLPLYALSAAVLLGGGSWEPGHTAAPAPAGGGYSVVGLLGIWIGFALLPACAEEMMYRGVLQPAFGQRWGPAWGIAVTSALFAFIHMEPAGLLPRMLMGVWFGYLAWRTGSLWASTWAHALNNTWGVALMAGPGLVSGHPLAVGIVSIASLFMAGYWFQRAGWLEPPGAYAGAPVDASAPTGPPGAHSGPPGAHSGPPGAHSGPPGAHSGRN